MAIGDRGRGVSDRSRGVSDRGRRPLHPAERDAVYDTVDQAALSKIEVRDRDENATTYRRVGADGTALAPRRPTGPGGHRRPGGPNDPNAAPDGPARPGRKVGAHGPRIWRERPLWLRRLVLFGSLGTFLFFIAGCAILYSATKVPLPASIKTDQSSIIYFSDGSTQLARFGTTNRTDVPLSQVSKPAQQAVLAAEDKNFYTEPGISYRGIARALLVNLKSGSVQQGASTITQQYVKNAYLTQDRTFSRKMKEIVISVKLSHKYSKDEILQYYLNTIYFGRNSYGIYAASEAYFGIPPSQLTAGQGAILAGLIRQPNYLDPAVHPDDAKARWKEVVNTMISQKWLSSMPDFPLATVKPKVDVSSTNGNVQNRYIQDQVVQELKDHGISEQQIETGGLRIRTTIDPARQQAAVDAVNKIIGPVYPNPITNLKTGLVALDPASGKILAWYGGSQYGKNPQSPDPNYASFIDTVTLPIPSGSTFKAVTLLTALSNGENLNSTYDASDPQKLPGSNGKDYVISNDEGDAKKDSANLIEATGESLNTVYVPLGFNIGGPGLGISKIITMARSLGISADLKPQAGITLGEDYVPPIEMASAYNSIASGGYRTTPHIVDTVYNGSNHLIYQGQPSPKKVLEPGVAADASFALQAVLKTGGTAASTAPLSGSRPAAGKTGTVQSYQSAWFCGFTPGQLTACVDMYRDRALLDPTADPANPKPAKDEALTGIPGAPKGTVYGGGMPAKIWKAFMDAALKNQPVKQFPPPVFGGTINNFTPTDSPTPTPTATSMDPGDLFDHPSNSPWNPLASLGFGQSHGTTSTSSSGNGGNGSGGGGGGNRPPTPTPAPTPTTRRSGGLLIGSG
ncbi:penicillin-binding protein [Frankia sp. AgB1.9]|nr:MULTISPECIES: transglycosylase domain-containing protein [unclassified Frankia]MBL7494035.1 penicillin-binding protein [Frankia sp. AgW1.1]MBL7547515.1 penicillin-binding protein [Frankia sp. AgB1.9]MBL7619025.1 penicillin-binding protein [Frankia sp. AgB1.8]